MLKGKVSCSLAVLAILGAVVGYLNGSVDAQNALGMIWAGLAVFGIRRAIQN